MPCTDLIPSQASKLRLPINLDKTQLEMVSSRVRGLLVISFFILCIYVAELTLLSVESECDRMMKWQQFLVVCGSLLGSLCLRFADGFGSDTAHYLFGASFATFLLSFKTCSEQDGYWQKISRLALPLTFYMAWHIVKEQERMQTRRNQAPVTV